MKIPQDLDAQVEKLAKARGVDFSRCGGGGHLCRTTLRTAYAYDYPGLPMDQFGGDLAAINVGLESFYDSLISQGGDGRPGGLASAGRGQ